MPYSNTPRLPLVNFRAKAAIMLNDDNSEGSSEKTILTVPLLISNELESKVSAEWKPPLEWAKFQHDASSEP